MLYERPRPHHVPGSVDPIDLSALRVRCAATYGFPRWAGLGPLGAMLRAAPPCSWRHVCHDGPPRPPGIWHVVVGSPQTPAWYPPAGAPVPPAPPVSNTLPNYARGTAVIYGPASPGHPAQPAAVIAALQPQVSDTAVPAGLRHAHLRPLVVLSPGTPSTCWHLVIDVERQATDRCMVLMCAQQQSQAGSDAHSRSHDTHVSTYLSSPPAPNTSSPS